MKKFLLILGIVIFLVFYLLVGISFNFPGSDFNTGENGIWLKHKWIGERQPIQKIKELANNLADHEVKYLFVHSGPFNGTGWVEPDRYPFVNYFLTNLKKIEPGLVPLAWLGQLRNKLDISDPEIRDIMADTAEEFVNDLGFAGVHINIEPIPNFDEDFITLLKLIKKRIGDDKILSVTVDEWQPYWITKLVSLHTPSVSFVSGGYLEEIAEPADQIVVMTYDSGLLSPTFYEWIVSQQVIYSTKYADEAKILIAIPAYDEEVPGSFDPKVENIETGLNGMIKGLNNIRTREENFSGVAIYSNLEMSEEEWKTYKSYWQKND